HRSAEATPALAALPRTRAGPTVPAVLDEHARVLVTERVALARLHVSATRPDQRLDSGHGDIARGPLAIADRAGVRAMERVVEALHGLVEEHLAGDHEKGARLEPVDDPGCRLGLARADGHLQNAAPAVWRRAE